MNTYINRFAVLTLTSLLALSTAACSDAGANDETTAAQEQAQVARIPVATQTVKAGEITSSFKTTATLEARDEADVTSKATGIIEEILVEEGDYVKAGQILAHMRDDEYRIQVAQANAELNSIKQKN
jgi:multidrug efflux pump subunit AcrA (membrane-fusion protein)